MVPPPCRHHQRLALSPHVIVVVYVILIVSDVCHGALQPAGGGVPTNGGFLPASTRQLAPAQIGSPANGGRLRSPSSGVAVGGDGASAGTDNLASLNLTAYLSQLANQIKQVDVKLTGDTKVQAVGQHGIRNFHKLGHFTAGKIGGRLNGKNRYDRINQASLKDIEAYDIVKP